MALDLPTLAPAEKDTYKIVSLIRQIVAYLMGGQLRFPATQNPSSDPNTLDDYEEGVWTPVLTFDTPGDLTVAYAAQGGTYTKIGRQVRATFNIVTSTFTHTTASGAVLVSGLPFTCAATHHYVGTMIAAGITKITFTQFTPRLRDTFGTKIEVTAQGSGVASANVVTTDMPTGGTVNFRGTLEYDV